MGHLQCSQPTDRGFAALLTGCEARGLCAERTPRLRVGSWKAALAVWKALQVKSVGRTGRNALSAAHAASMVHYADIVRHGERLELAMLDAIATANA